MIFDGKLSNALLFAALANENLPLLLTKDIESDKEPETTLNIAITPVTALLMT